MQITKNTPITILGCGGLGANLTLFLLEQNYKNITVIDADISDEKFFKRFTYFTGSRLLNANRDKVAVVKEIAHKRGYNLTVINQMVAPDFAYSKLEGQFVIISVDTLTARQNIELNLKKNNIPFIHIGCNLNSVSLFKTSMDILDSPQDPNAISSYVTVPDAHTYLVACLEILYYLNSEKIVSIYREGGLR